MAGIPNLKKIVSQLTDEVVNKLKEEGEFDEQPQPQQIINDGPSYIKLTKVNNGFILDMNTDDPSEQSVTEVIEIEDLSDPDAIAGILYGVAEWLGIEYIPNSNENLNITFDGEGENYNVDNTQPPSPLNQKKINSMDREDINRPNISDQAPPDAQPNVNELPPQMEEKKPSEITKEDVIRAAMGYPPENTIHEDELSAAEKLGVEKEDWEIDEDDLPPNQWAESDLKAEEYDELTKEQYKELDDLPDGDFDEDFDGDDGYDD